MPPPVEALTFDAAGTLFHLAEPVGETYSRLARPFGIKLSDAALNAAFRKAWKESPRMHSESGEGAPSPNETERQWWRALVETTFRFASHQEGSPVTHVPDELFTELFAHFAEPLAWRLYPETTTVLENLALRFPLAVISNFDRRFHQIADGMGISQFFQAVILSGNIGHAKPSGQIFAAACEALQLPADRLLHVGDDPEADWKGAQAAGYQSFKLDRPTRSLSDLIAANTGIL